MITPDAGSVGFPARLLGGRTAAVSLRPGSIVTLRTSLSNLTGRLEFVGSDIRLAPTVSVDLQPGKTVRLLVVSSSPQLLLKLLPDSLPANLSTDRAARSSVRYVLTALGLHNVDNAEEIVRALVNSHRELSPQLIRALSMRIGRDLPERGRQRRARAMVELADRDLDFDTERIDAEELLPLLTDGRWLSGKWGGHWESNGPSDDAPLSKLRAFLSRATSTPSHALQLFNHLKSSGDLHWVVIPIGAQKGESTTSGTLRVGIGHTDYTPREATLALEVGSGVWWFSWSIDNGEAALVSWEADIDAPEIPESLLARISRRGHTDPNRSHNGDGFSGTSSEVNKLGVDEYG